MKVDELEEILVWCSKAGLVGVCSNMGCFFIGRLNCFNILIW